VNLCRCSQTVMRISDPVLFEPGSHRLVLLHRDGWETFPFVPPSREHCGCYGVDRRRRRRRRTLLLNGRLRFQRYRPSHSHSHLRQLSSVPLVCRSGGPDQRSAHLLGKLILAQLAMKQPALTIFTPTGAATPPRLESDEPSPQTRVFFLP
jgi:hypothetical protein